MSSFIEPTAEYEYHHGTGKHILRKHDDEYEYARPKYSLTCILCQALDCLILLLVIAFLGGAFYLCYYLYNNYDGGG